MNPQASANYTLLTIQECADYIKCSRSTVRTMMKKKGFPVVRKGSIVRIVKDLLVPWLASPCNKQKKPKTPQHSEVAGEIIPVDLIAVTATSNEP